MSRLLLLFFSTSWEWDANITPSKANDLVEQGSLDLAGIAKRYKEKFPELFITPYKEENYYVSGCGGFQRIFNRVIRVQFQFTETDRTRDSFEAYAEGLFENKTGVNYVESNDVIKVSWKVYRYKHKNFCSYKNVQ